MDFLVLWNIIFNNNEENENVLQVRRIREQHIRISHFYEDVILNYSLTDFKSHFRVTRETFELLIQHIGPALLQRDNCPKILPDKQIAITLWIFGNQEVYRSVADRFGLCKDTIWRCVFNVAYILQEHAENYIKWPQHYEFLYIQEQFAAMSNFPGVVGVIDGCHIPISAPIEHPNSYINRKGFHSIILQGICDHKMKFIDVFAGICGSVHDARVWRLSDIKEMIDDDVERYFPQGTHLLGDSAYPLLQYLLIPYRDNGHLNNVQRNYNTKLSSTRITIEKAFGLLKGRFRKLRYVYMYNTEMIPLLVLACCILHNICIDNEDEPFENILEPMEDENNYNNVLLQGDEKRDIIAQLVY